LADLERDVTHEEIKKAVWDCGINKSPGPDGYTFGFFRMYWKIIDNDVVAAVLRFFSSGFISSGCNSSFIALIPKTQEAKHINSKAIIFKVDFEKAFDSVRWDYLDDVLNKFGFGVKWRTWIQGCLNSAMGYILVNGSPTSEFKFYKGLKQRDPLSPFLFILIMESLHISFKNVVNAGLYKGLPIDSSLNLSHLFYVDDAVFVASGLKINLYKSKLMGIGIPHEDVLLAAESIGCSTFAAPFNLLGVKVGGLMSRRSSWEEVIGNLSSRLSKWKLKTLSIGGRLTLIKSVLSSLPLYHMSIFKCPMDVLKLLESIRQNFFNGVSNSDRRLALIGWDKIMAFKKNDGLGVSSFFALNRALIFKWIWRFISNGFFLWARFIQAIYGSKGALDYSHDIPLRNSPWLDIIREVRHCWLSDESLKQTHPRLFLLKLNKNITVASKMRDPTLISSFRRAPRGGNEEVQFQILRDSLANVLLPQINDHWVWNLESSGDFSVKSARSFIDDLLLPKADVPTRWVKVVPIKINIFGWRVCLDKLPTRLNLSLRGIDIPSILCPLCSIAVESSSHLLFILSVSSLLDAKGSSLVGVGYS
ncbi:RNA-directed DNA polymerase, eukaryota, partial [Tanacetum coccineum]